MHDDLKRMARKAAMLTKKGQIEQAAPIIFQIENVIIHHSGSHTHKNLSQALDPVIRFYFTEKIESQHPNELALFLQRLPEYIRIYCDAFENILNTLPQNESEILLYVLVCSHLGNFYDAIELYDNAESDYKKAINTLTKHKKTDSELMAVVLCNLGHTYFMQGKENEAEKTWDKAYEIQKNAGREYSSVTLQILNYLSECVSDNKINAYIKKAVRIRNKIFPSGSPGHSESILAMAEMFRAQKKYSRAATYYKRALRLQQNESSFHSKKIFFTLYLLASLYVQMANHRAAHRYFINAQKEETAWINRMLFILSDRDRSKFLEETYKYLYLYVTFIKTFMTSNTGAVAAAYNIYLSRKGLLLESQKGFHEAIMMKAPPGIKAIMKKLDRTRSRLASAYHLSHLKIQETKDKYLNLERERQVLEDELRCSFAPYDLEKKIIQANTDDIYHHLPDGSALIEFAKIETYDYTKERFGNIHYYAFVMSKGRPCQALLEDLGKSENIDVYINKLRKSLMSFKGNIDQNYAEEESKSIKVLANRLYNIIFSPILKYIENINRLFICPDSELNLIPFEVLVDNKGKYLIQEFTFNYLMSGRDLLKPTLNKSEVPNHQCGKIVLMGNPDFALKLKRPKRKDFYTRDYNIYLSSLPNTREEILKISELFGHDETLIYLGKDACEKKLRSIKSPLILHLATHGFFLPDNRNNGKKKPANHRNIDDSRKKIIINMDNPLLCSGIALSGFNMAINSNGLNDGVMTAEEVLNLNLLGTQLVTLSACETGLGKIGLGEGVYGLRSAFARAGASAMVMSLWKVPDRETKDLMINFYMNMVKSGMNKSQALRNAALNQMNEMKKRYGHTHPRFWGGFIFFGVVN